MINLIVAIGKNNLIGKDNDLPWNYKEDLQYFKQTTLNKTVVIVIHDINFASCYSDNIVALKDGKLVKGSMLKIPS